MDYKKIFKSRSLRQKILCFLSWIPDKTMLKIQYRIKFGRKLNLKNPRRFTEKLQWYKLYYHNPLMIKCVDKYDVRDFVKECGYADILNECYGVFSSVDEIDFSLLPDSFVIKDTLGGGGNSVIICTQKDKLDISKLKRVLTGWISQKLIKGGGREWPYYCGNKNRIIIEKYIEPKNERGLVDYKFFCFNGNFKFLYVVCDRVLGENAKFGIYDEELNKLPVSRKGKDIISGDFEFPENINEMIQIAQKISSPFPHARVDLYNVDGKIIFGEITFYNASGYMSYDPDDFDFTLGDCFVLSKKLI